MCKELKIHFDKPAQKHEKTCKITYCLLYNIKEQIVTYEELHKYYCTNIFKKYVDKIYASVIYSISQKKTIKCVCRFAGGFMILHDEIYFEITLEGKKDDLARFAAFVTSGELDDFFEITEDYLTYDDDYDNAGAGDRASLTFSNDDFGIELSRFDPEEFLDVFCRGSKALYVNGTFYDIDDDEYHFISYEGEDAFFNAKSMSSFNDELDAQAREEEGEEEEDYEL